MRSRWAAPTLPAIQGSAGVGAGVVLAEVLISSKKYACETCIKGHRSSACKHTDRPLFEIKKKGRPVTQCEHCRELRKTKQVHVKCICELKEQPSSTPTPTGAKPKKKSTPVLPPHAAFPHGVPAECTTPSPSDSEQGGSAPSASGCSCKAGIGDCHCCTPRKRPGQRRSLPPPTSNNISTSSATILPSNSPSPTLPPHCNPPPLNPRTSPPLGTAPSSQTRAPSPGSSSQARVQSHHILARIAELRPVLPRLSPRDAALQAQAGGQHDLFHGNGHGHHVPGAPHLHTEHFSPYGRAYDLALQGHEGTSAGGFYQQDGRSVESLLSGTSLRSVSSLSGRSTHPDGTKGAATHFPSLGQKGTKSPKEGQSSKGHSQRSASFDGQPGTFGGYFGVAAPTRLQEVEWRLPPSLSRSSGNTDAPTYPRSEPSFPLSEELRPEAAYPRSDGVYPRITEAPRARSEDGFPVDLGMRMRMCGCGDGCACPGCSLHAGTSTRPSSSSNNANSASPTTSSDGQQHCTDAACGGACLDCTILGLQDFSAVVGFSGAQADLPSKQEGEMTLEGFPTRARGELRLEGYDVDADVERYGKDFDVELDMEGYDAGLAYGENTSTYEQIDEWIREVEALPPPSGPGQAPFEFGEGDPVFEFEANPGAKGAGAGGADGAGAVPEWGAVQMFDLNLDATTTTAASRRSHGGLAGGSPDPNAHPHGAGRSSSTTSSEVAGAVFGVAGGHAPAREARGHPGTAAAMELDHLLPPYMAEQAPFF
ncbi:hypothetical protein GGX14DRAFT_441107 [Mycena pura]|uniref:Copper-fist domain-containing protein n=1 Tax=Mycena pura TaxID=153505 RepID=A0AAD6YE31_9AGAR|nr:hypothetical protein GGX14DRAFT_441107 [Mycena pura]